MAARVAVAIVAVALLVFGVAARRDSEACREKGEVFFQAAADEARLTAAQADAFAGACRGSHHLALAADFLVRIDQPEVAQTLARTATRREPDNFEGWLALSRAQRAAGLTASAARALRRAVALNPRVGRTASPPG